MNTLSHLKNRKKELEVEIQIATNKLREIKQRSAYCEAYNYSQLSDNQRTLCDELTELIKQQKAVNRLINSNPKYISD